MATGQWDKYAFILSSKTRNKILIALDRPKTPTELASYLHINLSHVSRALAELRGHGLIACLTPKSRMGKLYSRTRSGEDVLNYLKKRV